MKDLENIQEELKDAKVDIKSNERDIRFNEALASMKRYNTKYFFIFIFIFIVIFICIFIFSIFTKFISQIVPRRSWTHGGPRDAAGDEIQRRDDGSHGKEHGCHHRG